MKTWIVLSLPLAAILTFPAVAQSSAPGNQQPSPNAVTDSSSTRNDAANSDQDLSSSQPLQPEVHEGFWGHLNPFARKKYVQRQMTPIRDRVNELDELTAGNSRQIKDVDARAQEGIRQASAKASGADQHAVDAGNRAQQANQTALQASNRLNQVEQVVGTLDQYQPASNMQVRFPAGHTTLGPKAKAALDDMAANLSGQKGYVIEVRGFSATHGQAGIQSSQAMANSVVRYLVEQHNIPVYRIFVMGMGNAKVQTAPANTESSSNAKANGRPAPNRVEVTLLKNNLDQLAANGTAQQASTTNSSQARQR